MASDTRHVADDTAGGVSGRDAQPVIKAATREASVRSNICIQRDRFPERRNSTMTHLLVSNDRAQARRANGVRIEPRGSTGVVLERAC
jgi:hypothetical protein